MSYYWTPDRMAALCNLHAEGLSFAQIAARIGGISRNACIGKAGRMGLTARAPRREGRKRGPLGALQMPRSTILSKPLPLPVAPANAPEAIGPIRDFPATKSCRFIAGDPHDAWQCCGEKAVRFDIPWCLFHLRIVFQPIRARKPEAEAA